MELYIHIPFCLKKCNYCDFLSYPGCPKNASDYAQMEKYIEALCRELRALCSGEYGAREYTSVFIGGGTPSILPIELMERLLYTVKAVIGSRMAEKGFEYTIECNPGTLSAEKLELYRKYGINRISLGLQSTEDKTLKVLGRIHTYGQFLEAYEMARAAGFDNINVDLISAVPGQTAGEWEKCLRTVAELKPEHISAYSLIIEPGTPFWNIYSDDINGNEKGEQRRNSGLPELPGEDEEREMYEATVRIVKEYGYERYEISNYAKPGFESKHNLGYWTGEEYLGVGLGASSYVKGTVAALSLPVEKSAKAYAGDLKCEPEKESCIAEAPCYLRYRNTDNMQEYIECMMNGKPQMQQCDLEELDTKALMTEYMILHLRLTRGADENEFMEKFGVTLYEKYGSILDSYESLNLLKREGGRCYLTEKGLNVSNVIMAEF